jgi:hypothetical protein
LFPQQANTNENRREKINHIEKEQPKLDTAGVTTLVRQGREYFPAAYENWHISVDRKIFPTHWG